ncbi:hypothetical protein GHT06_001738 [Daphnia sinensis]|uniref:Uncharacterized protein n=1 Tax=Daphnia sinensis TaxID=1820382 RepID=A0AAD5KVZ0_9CRUS|nr:hypothetical protein GHT06_001738 [Daphnia sinensis]
MEIHKGIPSYITFGSYKDPLMVSYAGQMHTCRMCDSPTHVLANCPKQPHKTNRKAQEAEPIGGGQMPIAPIGDAMSTVVVLNKAPEDPISKPVKLSLFLTPILTLKTLAKMKETREFRDQQKQSKKGLVLLLPFPPARNLRKLSLM